MATLARNDAERAAWLTMAAAKRRGVQLGNPSLDKVRKRGTAAVKAGAKQFAANVLPIIREIERAGATSNAAIAAKLNERGVRTARGGRWTHVSSRRRAGASVAMFKQMAALRARTGGAPCVALPCLQAAYDNGPSEQLVF
jgi:hypothetical protein